MRLSRQDGIDALLAKHKLDAIVTLTSGPAWFTDHVNGDRDTGGCTTPAAVAGYPHITVPAGFYSGLPIGLSFFSTAWSEPTLIKLAYAWEQQMNARRKPGSPPALRAKWEMGAPRKLFTIPPNTAGFSIDHEGHR
jgi:amidase